MRAVSFVLATGLIFPCAAAAQSRSEPGPVQRLRARVDVAVRLNSMTGAAAEINAVRVRAQPALRTDARSYDPGSPRTMGLPPKNKPGY